MCVCVCCGVAELSVCESVSDGQNRPRVKAQPQRVVVGGVRLNDRFVNIVFFVTFKTLDYRDHSMALVTLKTVSRSE